MSIYKSDLNLAVELGKVVNSISILENGNVGIGTNNPTELLTIGNLPYQDGTRNLVRFNSKRHNDGFIIRNNDDIYNANLEIIYNSSGASCLSLHHTGNVGIGTTNPKRNLDLHTGQITFSNNVTTDSQAGIFWHDGDTYGIYRTPGGWSGNYQQLMIRFNTGIILDPGSGGNPKSHVGVVGGMSIGDSYYGTKYDNGLIVQGNVGIGTTSPAEKLEINGWIGRSAHNNGGLCGSYQTSGLGENSTKTNPIYVIGTGYKPNENDLNNMYGIGYTHTNASFISSDSGSGWGMYVAADGDARIFLNAGTGSMSVTGYYYGNGSQLTSLNANNITSLSADKMGYGPNQTCRLHIGPAHWAGLNQDAENVIQYEHEITFPGYRDNNAGGYRLASKITGFGISSPYYWDGYATGVNWRAMYAGGLSFYTCDSGWSGGDQTNKVLTLYKSNAYLKGSLYQNSDNMGTSDLRIKRDIIDINKNEILDKFLKINVKKYKYKDKKRKNKEVYGFIAQEIKEIIDDKGVSLDHNFIYDINEYGTIESNIITCECNLELNTQYRVIINDIKERDIIVKDNLENNKYRIDGYIHNYEEYNSDKIFIQGREVNDFHYLNKNAIFTMNVNVTQELYKMIIDQNKLIKEKEEEIKKQNEILNNLIYRIELLENK